MGVTSPSALLLVDPRSALHFLLPLAGGLRATVDDKSLPEQYLVVATPFTTELSTLAR